MATNLETRRRDGDTNEKLIKRFSKHCKRLEIVKEVRDRRYFKKPSEKRREKEALQKYLREKESEKKDKR